MSIQYFDLPSGKRKIHIDDHEITEEEGLDDLLKFINDPVTISPKAQSIARLEDIRRRVLVILGEVNEIIEEMK